MEYIEQGYFASLWAYLDLYWQDDEVPDIETVEDVTTKNQFIF